MRWTRQRRARIGNRRAAPTGLVSDQAARRRTALFSPSLKLWRTGPSKPLVQTGRGRQSRVVLAPVAGVKSAEASRPDRAWQNLNPPTTVTRRIRSPGRAAQGRPGVSGEPVVITLACFVLFRTRGRGCSGHPAFPAPSVIGGTRLLKPRAHRAARTRIRVLTLSTTLVRASPPWLRTARWPWGTRTCARRRVSGVAEGGP